MPTGQKVIDEGQIMAVGGHCTYEE